ncbi:MAG: metallophosphoesterase [Clostridia bacterium]|nr:metallophosphoesterase [Clostridia bacterium]
MSTLKQRFLLVSDMHYSVEETPEEYKKIYPNARASVASGNAFGKTQRQKIEKIYEDIMEEQRRSPLDAVLVLGDLSIDDYDHRQLPISYCKKFKEDCMDRLPVPSYAIPGNHDSWPNDLWKEMMGYDRQYVLEFGDVVFLMADTFPGTPAMKHDPGSGSAIAPIDDEFLRTNLEKYKGKKIFICAHHIDGIRITDEGKRLIKESGDVVYMYRGHVHIHSVNDMGEECGNVKLIDIGGYGYAGQVVNGKYTFNVYDYAWAWGYQIVEIYDDKVRTYHVKTANHYVADNGVFDVEEAVLNDMEYKF